MSAYFDTSVVTKWYVREADSEAALRLRQRFEPPATLTHLHRLELSNAWHLKVFRKEMKKTELTSARGDLQADVDAGIWLTPDYDLSDVFRRAEELSSLHTPKLGTQSLDILHVAAAMELSARTFVTGDAKQAKLAMACRLEVVHFGR
ncbi:MAG TPA: type II toxin-antitoxin system VapC family toxin [Polyangiaceae bacterium]